MIVVPCHSHVWDIGSGLRVRRIYKANSYSGFSNVYSVVEPDCHIYSHLFAGAVGNHRPNRHPLAEVEGFHVNISGYALVHVWTFLNGLNEVGAYNEVGPD